MVRRLVAWGNEEEALRAFYEAAGQEAELISRGGRSLLVLPHDEATEELAKRFGLSFRVEDAAPRWELVALSAPEAWAPALEPARIVRAHRRGRVVRFQAEGPVETQRRALLESAHRQGFDLAIQPADVLPQRWRLVVLDMDSTLITIEMVDELARACGRYEEVARITERAMQGELDFEQSLRARVALLAGESVEVLERLVANLPLSPGAERLVAGLKKFGIRVAVLSGGFTPAVEALRRRLGLDYAHANHLEVREGRLTGGLVGPIVDAARNEQHEIGLRYGEPGVFYLDASLFWIDSRDELVVDRSEGGRTTYRNAGATERRGAEVSGDWLLAPGWWTRYSVSYLDAEYSRGEWDGNRLPGIADTQLYAQLRWEPWLDPRLSLAVMGRHRSDVATGDDNQTFAPSSTVWDFTVRSQHFWCHWSLDIWAQLANVTDERYVGSVIVNQGNGRSFEPAPGRNLSAGLALDYRW